MGASCRPRSSNLTAAPRPRGDRARIWNFSASVLRELRRIDDDHAVDVVQVPNWNSEGIAVLEDGGFTSVLGLHTPLETIARIDPRIDPENLEVRQLLALERRCYEQATGIPRLWPGEPAPGRGGVRNRASA